MAQQSANDAFARLTEENAKKEWQARFTGAILSVPVTFGSPLVQHMFKRVFDITGRNSHFISVFGRILLGEEQVAKPEEHVVGTVRNAKKEFEDKIRQYEVVCNDAEITSFAIFNAPQSINAKVVSPIQREFLRVLELADKEIGLLNTLWIQGEVKDNERTKREREIKWRLRGIATSARNMFLSLRKKLNQVQGKAKEPDSAPVVEPAAAAGDGGAAGDAAASNVIAVATARKPRKPKTTPDGAEAQVAANMNKPDGAEPAAAAGG